MLFKVKIKRTQETEIEVKADSEQSAAASALHFCKARDYGSGDCNYDDPVYEIESVTKIKL